MVPLRGAFYSAASGPADRRRIMSAAQLALSLKNGPKIRGIQKSKKKSFFGIKHVKILESGKIWNLKKIYCAKAGENAFHTKRALFQ